MIPFCADIESQAAAITDPAENKKFWKEKKAQSSIPKIITTGYHSLNLIHFFTCGADEVRCWTVQVSISIFSFYISLSFGLMKNINRMVLKLQKLQVSFTPISKKDLFVLKFTHTKILLKMVLKLL